MNCTVKELYFSSYEDIFKYSHMYENYPRTKNYINNHDNYYTHAFNKDDKNICFVIVLKNNIEHNMYCCLIDKD